MYGRPEFLIFNVETLKYDVIENKADYHEFDLNMKNGWIRYSDFPVYFDIDSYNDFKESKKEVIYIYIISLLKKNCILILQYLKNFLQYGLMNPHLSILTLIMTED